MSRINPEVLKNERNAKKWSIDDLAKKSRINRQTIHRIERGDNERNRKDVIERVAKALAITEDALTTISDVSPANTAPPNAASVDTATDDVDHFLQSSQMNLRIANQARNALVLAARRYNVTFSQVIELAPFLFCWAAERSLWERKERLSAIAKNADELSELQARHLHGRAFNNWRADETLAAESNSINANDIFGQMIIGDRLESYKPDDYDEGSENPFATFIQSLADEIGDGAELERWSPVGSPYYTVCAADAHAIVANDTDAANAILNGDVLLHQLPKPLRGKGMGKERAEWVREQAAESRQKWADELAAIGFDSEPEDTK